MNPLEKIQFGIESQDLEMIRDGYKEMTGIFIELTVPENSIEDVANDTSAAIKMLMKEISDIKKTISSANQSITKPEKIKKDIIKKNDKKLAVEPENITWVTQVGNEGDAESGFDSKIKVPPPSPRTRDSVSWEEINCTKCGQAQLRPDNTKERFVCNKCQIRAGG